MIASTVDIERARDAAIDYRRMNFNPLPSSGRRPLLRSFGRERDEGIPGKWLEKWWAPNLQICTGVRWKLAVIDLDGPLALDVWAAWTLHRAMPPTWAVAHTPGSGMHLWYAVSDGIESLPFDATLWRLEGGDHTGIQLLGDRNLIVAPPSTHPKSGRRYAWLPGRSPSDLPLAPLPAWVVERALASHPRRERSTPTGSSPVPPIAHPFRRYRPMGDRGTAGWTYPWRSVLDAIADKVSLALSWGLRLVAREPNPAGWLACRAIAREDRDPSAMFSATSGRYWEPPLGRCPLSLFDLAVALGVYPDFATAVSSLGCTYGVPG